MDFAYSKSDLNYQPQCFDEEVPNNFGACKSLCYGGTVIGLIFFR